MHLEAPLVRAAVLALPGCAAVVAAAHAAWSIRHASDAAVLNNARAKANFTCTYAVQDIENEVLMQTVVPAVQRYGGRVSSLHFDGLVATLLRPIAGPGNLTFVGMRDAVNIDLAARGTPLRVAIKDWELPPGIDLAAQQQGAAQQPADAQPLPENSPHREFLLRALGRHCGDLTSAYISTYDGLVSLQAGGLGRPRQRQRHHHIFRNAGVRQCPHRMNHVGGEFELVEDGSRLLYVCKDPVCAARPAAEICHIPAYIFATDRRVVSNCSFDPASAERALSNIIKVKQGEIANSDSDSDHAGLQVVDGHHIRPATQQAALRAMGEYVNRFFVAIERGGQGGEPMIAHLDYAKGSPERVTAIRFISLTSLQKLLAQLNMDSLLEKNCLPGDGPTGTSPSLTCGGVLLGVPSGAWSGKSSFCQSVGTSYWLMILRMGIVF